MYAIRSYYEYQINLQFLHNINLQLQSVKQKSLYHYFQHYKKHVITSYSIHYTKLYETKDGDEKLKASGKFVVVKSNVEAQNLVANHKTLFEISSKTGGRFIMPQNIDSLPVFSYNFV